MNKELEQLKAECDMYKTFYRAKHSDIKGLLFKYKQILQEIKAIAEKRSKEGLTCNYYKGLQQIIDLITKSESEVE